MKVYHGSPNGSIKVLERRQSNTGEHLPEHETRNAIYLTTDFAFALLAGARPRGEGGGVRSSTQNKAGNSLEFIDPKKFDPKMPVFIYEWDISDLPPNSYTVHPDGQVVVDLDELKTQEPIEYLAEKIFEYYEFSNWPPMRNEQNSELRFN